MTGIYNTISGFLVKYRLIYLGIIIIVWSFFTSQLPNMRFDMSDTLWLSGGETQEEANAGDFTILAFEMDVKELSPNRAADLVIDAIKDIKGVSDPANFRLIPGLSKRLKDDVGVVTFQADLLRKSNLNEFDAKLRQSLSQFKWMRQYHFLGKNVLNAELIELTRKDMGRLLPWVFVICLAIMLLLYKNIFIALLPVINIFLTLVATLSIYMLLGRPITITATILPPLMLVLCLNDSIYVLNALIRGKDEMLKLLPSCLQTGMALVISFIAMMFTNYRPIYDLGIMGMIAVIFSLFSALFVLPVVLSFIKRPYEIKTSWISEKVWRAMYAGTYKYKSALLIMLLILTVGIVYMLKETRLGADARQYFRSPNKLTEALDFFIDKGLPVDRIVLYVRPVRGYEIGENELEKWTEGIAGRPKVIGTVSQIDFLNFDIISAALTPEKISYYRDMGRKYFPDGLGGIRIDIYEQFTSTGDAKKFTDWFNGWFTEQNTGDSAAFRGGAYLSWLIETDHAKSQLRGFVFAMAAVLLLFIMLFGTRVGIMAALENCWPILATVALVNMFGIPLNFVTILIANLVIGLATEDTFYLLNRYKMLRENGLGVSDAFAGSTVQLGNSSVFSSVIMAAGFVLLGLSDFNPTFQLGMMATFAIMAALFADLIILPLLLDQFDRRS